jgi:hypothetical protein
MDLFIGLAEEEVKYKTKGSGRSPIIFMNPVLDQLKGALNNDEKIVYILHGGFNISFMNSLEVKYWIDFLITTYGSIYMVCTKRLLTTDTSVFGNYIYNCGFQYRDCKQLSIQFKSSSLDEWNKVNKQGSIACIHIGTKTVDSHHLESLFRVLSSNIKIIDNMVDLIYKKNASCADPQDTVNLYCDLVKSTFEQLDKPTRKFSLSTV